MTLLQWPGRTNFDGFRERFKQLVLQHLPAAELTDDAEFGVKIAGLPSGNSLNIWLERAYKEFVDDPARADAILNRWLAQVLQGAREREPVRLEQLVPMIKDRAWLDAQRAHANGDADCVAHEPYNDELIIAYARRNAAGLTYVRRSDLEALGVPEHEIRSRATATMRTLLQPRHVNGGEGVYLVGVGGTFEASLLLVDDVWRDARLMISGSPLVGVPDRDSFIVGDDALPSTVWRTAQAVAYLNEQEPYPISSRLFRSVQGRFVSLDPHAADAAHPIPDLDTLDAFGKLKSGGVHLLLVIASPLHADARSIFRLFRKLRGYAKYIASNAYREECGEPSPSSTTIEISIHPHSAPEVFELLATLDAWAEERNCAIKVTRRNLADVASPGDL